MVLVLKFVSKIRKINERAFDAGWFGGLKELE